MPTGQGKSVPASRGVIDQTVTLQSTTEPEQITPEGVETRFIAVRAFNAANQVFIGFDDSVDNNSFPLLNEDTISLELDVSEQPLFALPDNTNDEVRVLGIR
jgi:hypothetical protein